ncbi:GspH/FimT family pseudopilin [Gilvimarinus sp. DA14]|uniref:GspH/FimT family pseudopilin n=1 Tax=Gilvimarinus sp. DA14 TaxID=2956798 RepID=UPI0020B798B5|nr:GspH/FimT family pseudopilin [Gilvimarinus sp. DA14]UTF59831.1 prepilin-type N-terminal cleavage/methylation domain-containing protein [Gilvimarinus sp. DA14]
MNARAANPGITSGFTLLELMVALAIAAVLMAAAVPAANKMYASMQYRGAVAEVKSMLEAGRYQASTTGDTTVMLIKPKERKLTVGSRSEVLPNSITIDVISAAELRPDSDTAAIQFYPDGSSSGGTITLTRNTGQAVTLSIGWLLGEVEQISAIKSDR